MNKILTHTFCIILFFSNTLFCQTIKKDDVYFKVFINSFPELDLPLSIKLDDLSEYTNYVFGKGADIIKNPIWKDIEKKDYEFLSKYPVEEEYYYAGFYKKEIGEKYILMIEKNSHNVDDFFIYLNSYDSNGNLLDTLCIAGQRPEGIYIDTYIVLCHIDTNFQINRTGAQYLTSIDETKKGRLLITQETFIYTEEGLFSRITFKQEEDYFEYIGGKYVKRSKKKD